MTSSARVPDVGGTGVVTWRQWLLALAVGLGLVAVVWHGLLTGGGLVGGDTYPYFMPQKLVYAESLAAGEIPLWHHLTGLGYPLLAESQAGVFYPPNQILYRLLDLNSAYNASILLHYGLAFVFAWRYARCEGITTWPALLTAMIFVYGWFPARLSLEWSIIGGVWLPVTLWRTRALLDQPSPMRFVVLAACLGTHLLAGHFALAFINQLTVALYAFVRPGSLSQPEVRARMRSSLMVAGAIGVSLGLAAIQIVPTWELKQSSQREAGPDEDFDPAYGHMPPLYATQVVASWFYWHAPETRMERAIQNTPGSIDADTNAVEAHLYWGLLPVLLMLSLLHPRVRRSLRSRSLKAWILLTMLAMIYATGWLLPVTRHLPGFRFFIGPGRYTIVCALGGALLTGWALDAICFRKSSVVAAVMTIVVGAITLPDLMQSSKYIADAVVVTRPPITALESSWINQYFADRQTTSRLLVGGPNVCNLFGVSCVPHYLGIGPDVYFDDAFRPSTAPANPDAAFPDDETLQQIRELGITHVLATDPIRKPSEALRRVNAFPDQFLNTVWIRGLHSCYLFAVDQPGERIATDPPGALQNAQLLRVTPNTVEFEVDVDESCEVVLRELMYPGWTVTVDGSNAEARSSALSMRTTTVEAGHHVIRWTFEPRSFQIGALISVNFAMALIVTGLFARRGLRSNQAQEKVVQP